MPFYTVGSCTTVPKRPLCGLGLECRRCYFPKVARWVLDCIVALRDCGKAMRSGQVLPPETKPSRTARSILRLLAKCVPRSLKVFQKLSWSRLRTLWFCLATTWSNRRQSFFPANAGHGAEVLTAPDKILATLRNRIVQTGVKSVPIATMRMFMHSPLPTTNFNFALQSHS